MKIHYLVLSALACIVSTNLSAASDPFVGKWKWNGDKSKVSGLEEKIEDLGGNKFKFAFGDDVETIVLDGKDYPTKYGYTWAVKEDGPNKWKEIDKRDGKVTATASWTISDDGKIYTSITKGTRPDGSTYHNEFKAKRTAGGPGLAGTWESTEVKQSAPAAWKITPYQGDGLSFRTPAEKEGVDLKFDGKDYPDKGPRVPPGSTVSGKRIDQRKIELSNKLKGKPFYSQQLEVSEDGKTLTIVLNFPGVSNPETDIYDRQ